MNKKLILIFFLVLSLGYHYLYFYMFAEQFEPISRYIGRIMLVLAIFFTVSAFVVACFYALKGNRLDHILTYVVIGIIIGCIVGTLGATLFSAMQHSEQWGNEFISRIKSLYTLRSTKVIVFTLLFPLGWLFGGIYSVITILWLRQRYSY